MTLTIDLNSETQDRLNAEAARLGVAPEEYALKLIEDQLAADRLPAGHSLAKLFAKWDAEDATDDPQEITRRQREWEALKQSLNQHHGSHRVPIP